LVFRPQVTATGSDTSDAATNNKEGLSQLIKDFLGDKVRIITNKKGDKIFISVDGQRKVRFDVKYPHGDEPHMHVQVKDSFGEWVDATDQHRFYPGK
jgi:hypothetical protein